MTPDNQVILGLLLSQISPFCVKYIPISYGYITWLQNQKLCMYLGMWTSITGNPVRVKSILNFSVCIKNPNIADILNNSRNVDVHANSGR